MRDLLPTIAAWGATDPDLAMATVVRTTGSTPRPVGAHLLVSRDGRMEGSVSGGCLEGAVVLEAQATIEGEAPPRVLHYGISDELGWSVGLSCGGEVDVFVETLRGDGSDPALRAVRDAVTAERPVALLTVLSGPDAGSRVAWTGDQAPIGDLGTRIDAPALAAAHLASGLPGVEVVEGLEVFVEPIVRDPRLAVIGAVHIAVPLTAMAAAAGYRVIVIDPRAAFLTRERMPLAQRLVDAWPDEALPGLDLGPADAAVCLAHDPKFEDPALRVLLRTSAGYIGAIGSRTTHAARVARLREGGFSDADIARVHSPVGLDLGAVTPAEIALAILAEIVATRRGRSGQSLSRLPGRAAAATVA